MNRESFKKFLSEWLRIDKLIPLFIFLTAETLVIIDWIGGKNIGYPINVIIALIGILGGDAFLERVKILDRIEKKLSNVSEDILIRWDRLPDIEGQTGRAKEICIVSPAMATLINTYPRTIENIIQRGCKIKILLLNPFDKDALENWKRLQKDKVVNEMQIRNTITSLKSFMKEDGKKYSCEIRFSEVFIPFSMLAVDMEDTTEMSSMNVEFHGYKTSNDVRPHIVLNPKEDYFWFKFYKDQFNAAWNSSEFINLSDL